jgi:hypothetical protein
MFSMQLSAKYGGMVDIQKEPTHFITLLIDGYMVTCDNKKYKQSTARQTGLCSEQSHFLAESSQASPHKRLISYTSTLIFLYWMERPSERTASCEMRMRCWAFLLATLLLCMLVVVASKAQSQGAHSAEDVVESDGSQANHLVKAVSYFVDSAPHGSGLSPLPDDSSARDTKRKRQRKRGQKAERRHMRVARDRRRVHALFDAIIEPVAPKNVTFPLSEEDEIAFHAAQDCLMDHVMSHVYKYNLDDAHVKRRLRKQISENRQKTEMLLFEAVKSGMTISQALVGMGVAQVQALDNEFITPHLKSSEERMKTLRKLEYLKHNECHRAEKAHYQELAALETLRARSTQLTEVDFEGTCKFVFPSYCTILSRATHHICTASSSQRTRILIRCASQQQNFTIGYSTKGHCTGWLPSPGSLNRYLEDARAR